MDYPHDKPDFTSFTKATLQVLRKAPLLETPLDFYLEPISDDLAPEAAALLHTLAHHSRPRTYFAWRELKARYDDDEGDEEERLGAWEDYGLEEDDPACFDPSKAFVLGESSGGEVVFGFHWDGGALRFFEIDVEGEMEEPLAIFGSADAFWEHVSESEYDYAEMEGEEAPEFLVELFAAAGRELEWPV